MVAAFPTHQSHLIDVLLIDGKDLADLPSGWTVNAAQPLVGQHRAGEEEGAAHPALKAFSFARSQLPLDIFLSKADQIIPPKLADQEVHEMASPDGSDVPAQPATE